MLLETTLKPFRAKKIFPLPAVLQAYKGLYAQLYIQSMYRKYVHHFLTKVANNVCLSARSPPEKIGRCRSRPTPFFSLTFDYGFSSYRRFTKKRWVGSSHFCYNSPGALTGLGLISKSGLRLFRGGACFLHRFAAHLFRFMKPIKKPTFVGLVLASFIY